MWYSVDEKLSFLGENAVISRQSYNGLYYGMEDAVGINAKGISLLYMISARIRGLCLSVIGLTRRFFHVFGVLLYVFLTLNDTVYQIEC